MAKMPAACLLRVCVSLWHKPLLLLLLLHYTIQPMQLGYHARCYTIITVSQIKTLPLLLLLLLLSLWCFYVHASCCSHSASCTGAAVCCHCMLALAVISASAYSVTLESSILLAVAVVAPLALLSIALSSVLLSLLCNMICLAMNKLRSLLVQ
jgi:hypothetical protein